MKPAVDLVALNTSAFPNESTDYRKARNALLAEEIELRRRVERVAKMRRALPPGGEIPADYAFVGEEGPVLLSELFEARYALRLQLHVRTGARQALPNVHINARRLRR